MAYPYYQVYPNYNQMFLPPMQQPQQNVQTSSQIQNGGFIIVKDINEAINYPVAPGNSVTFKNENQPYIYTKTLGFSQLDQPIFETFKLVKEEKQLQEEPVAETGPGMTYLTLEEAQILKGEIDGLKAEVQFLKDLIADDNREVASI